MQEKGDAQGGLVVRKENTGWGVWHASSDLSAATGLRLRKFAEEARTELLATGVDFTADARAIGGQHRQWATVYYRWRARAQGTSLDPDTFEYYSAFIRYGAKVPNAEQAALMREDIENVGLFLDGKLTTRQV
jgi:hypothetical protein